jgi:hypothetical protein
MFGYQHDFPFSLPPTSLFSINCVLTAIFQLSHQTTGRDPSNTAHIALSITHPML